MKYRKCPDCGSIYVCWNWFFCVFWKTWLANIAFYKFPYFRWQFWKFFDRWYHECWNCSSGCFSTFFKVKNGIPPKICDQEFKYEPKHELRDAIEEINYLFYSSYRVWKRSAIERRSKEVLIEIEKLLMHVAKTAKEE